MQQLLGDSFNYDVMKSNPHFANLDMPLFEPYADDHNGEHSQVPDIDNVDPKTYDVYVGTKVGLLIGDKVMTGKVKQQKCESDGTLKGMAHSNPILDMQTYEVEFPDGQIAKYSANIIAENMYTQCDTEGNQYLLLKEIVDWKKDASATYPAGMYVTHSVNKHFCKTTKGWQLCVEWKDGTTSWE